MEELKVVAIVVGAGVGTRFGGTQPKQYTLLGGTPIFLQSLQAFLCHPGVAEVIPVINANHRALYEQMISANRPQIANLHKLKEAVMGDCTRGLSTYRALQVILPREDIQSVLIHDAVRPLISDKIITRVIRNTSAQCGCIPAIPVHDTLKRVNSSNELVEELDRTSVVKVQTPQGFPFSLVKRLAPEYLKSTITDDSSIFFPHLTIKTVPGSHENEKITTSEQVEYLHKITNPQPKL